MRIEANVAAELTPWFPALPRDDVRIVTGGPISWFVGHVLRQDAMTFAPFIFFRSSKYDPADTDSVALLAHELKHVEQYQRFGHVGFLVRYFRDLAGRGFRYSRDLPLERDAYELQAAVARGLAENPGSPSQPG